MSLAPRGLALGFLPTRAAFAIATGSSSALACSITRSSGMAPWTSAVAMLRLSSANGLSTTAANAANAAANPLRTASMHGTNAVRASMSRVWSAERVPPSFVSATLLHTATASSLRPTACTTAASSLMQFRHYSSGRPGFMRSSEHWRDRLARYAKTSFYGIIVLAGAGAAGYMLWNVASEMFSEESVGRMYADALDRVRENAVIAKVVGPTISGLEEGRGQPRMGVQQFDFEGVTHTRLNFPIKGEKGEATVSAEMHSAHGEYMYRYLYVETPAPPGKNKKANVYVIIQPPPEKKPAPQAKKGWFS
ncbi:hypothetical protein CAOG_07697 [Capsaspora owczarzaki ATCC 30864]|uniref:Mitochondrial import inner membrane translocase subunit Tim21 n=1 Tax=Capsaspora owczarzaki (strain ATCC 30864) TaxID=595528 RepID=A0A0D2WWB6_CAPO3|nr:hypothetical protein CAOG_07697 [Capsaspora owczarzaki ATCC 30864]KJE97260.1 hypothetical protein CAOG_007697 [Capsaspora owczarzaki ATCC 30864]|eukprot:XP_004343571.1 hypothetical protein CAOG_07697 [Capsaspora owczarzaki ATCC 30864]